MKTNQIKILILVFFSLSLYQARGQKAVIAAGADATGSGGSISYSVGQIVYTTATGSNGSASQGVQQPYEIFVVGLDKNPEINLELSVYPNPTPSRVTLNIGNLDPEKILCMLFDDRGKLLNSQNIHSALTVVPMENLAPGIYFLKVMDDKTLLRTFKIVKN
ncbi:MAG: T9SS type A sorting domain-containing protein [Bacteroidetes bacterium]|nr:T9SS type A sorting domain-containing protein [Bacteroidota bacterium]